jgi:hypothetical protein
MNTTYGTPDPLKANILEALHAFIRSRPGLEYGNYGDPAAYRSELRRITRDLQDARTLLHSIERAHGITGRNLVDAASTTRLNIQTLDGDKVRVHYTTGQYYPTEYRRAVAAVCASALWDYVRDYCMPPGELMHNSETGETLHRYGGLRAGDWLRRYFRREFGRGLASRHFN